MKATTVLQVVHDPRTSCMRAESPPRTLRQTLDTTLDESRTAIETVREILDCPCARSIRVAIILVLITQQVMESYRTILTEHRSTPAAQCEKSLSGLNLSTSDIPMAIGRYHLDEEIRAKVIVQVLGCEMERIGSVLDILARYAKGMAQRPEELVLGSYIGSLQASRQDLLKSLQMSENC
ncbi:hypothetical protein BDV28DRAFT_127452 [Aspergillus coremiiformis]|uniref:Aflatoxin regulatory protein domain-containing protein n=1 Tax=Aspergillus coremiiformis TaxID=138285 RepID=A0A5N6ZJG8_9EURO|nr:hypothetical protein BDV28DRAFT_127452 [Aspergillus coremiiformis]